MAKTSPMLCGSFAIHASRIEQMIHNAVYEKQGLHCTHVAFGIADGGEAIAAIRALGIRGVSLTDHYRTTVADYLDVVDDDAETLGAVTTIINDDGVLTGCNLDWLATVQALDCNNVEISDKRVYVVGAGSAAQAAIYGLKRRNAGAIKVFNRTPDNAVDLANTHQVGCGGPLTDMDDEYDILIHATPAGGLSYPGECVVHPTCLNPDATILDLVAEPMPTPLQTRAHAHKCKVVA